MTDVSLGELAAERRDGDLPTYVFVDGNPTTDPPQGRATACRVAHLLKADAGNVVEANLLRESEHGDLGDVDLKEMTPDDVLLVTASRAVSMRPWLRLLRFVNRLRTLGFDVVIHADELPKPIFEAMNVQVVSGDGLAVYKLEWNLFENRLYKVAMRGLS